MGTVLAKKIVDDARNTLGDGDRVRFTDGDLLGYLNAGQGEITILRGDVSVEVRKVSLTVGSTLQTLEAPAIRLVKVTRNMGAGGTVPGRIIRITDHDELDRVNPLWHQVTGAFVKNYTFDPDSPKSFYVTPAPSGALYVEAHIQVAPEKATMFAVDGASANSVIAVDDVYETALHDYVVMRAKSRDTDVQDLNRSDSLYRAFLQRLGLRIVSDKASDPNRNAPPHLPAQDQGSPDGKPNI